MANNGSSLKRHAQSERRRADNKSVRSEVRSSIKKFLQTITTNNRAEAEKRYLETQKLLDTAVSKGVYHRNTAARTKSRLSLKLNKLAAT